MLALKRTGRIWRQLKMDVEGGRWKAELQGQPWSEHMGVRYKIATWNASEGNSGSLLYMKLGVWRSVLHLQHSPDDYRSRYEPMLRYYLTRFLGSVMAKEVPDI